LNAAALKHRGPGRPSCCPREIVTQIIQLHRRGLSLERISAVLNAEGIPTPLGRPRWSKSHVDRLLHARYVQEILVELDTGVM
jgi:hypothetical protein